MAAEEFNLNDPVGSFGETWKRVVTEPRSFFESLSPAGGLQPALAFAAICLAIGGVEVLLFGGGLKGMLGLVVIGLLRIFVGAAVIAIIAQNLFESRGDYEATFRILAYSSAVAVVIGIPVIKYIAGLYGIYLVIVGIEKAHSLATEKAMLTVIATGVVLGVLSYAFGLANVVRRANPLWGW